VAIKPGSRPSHRPFILDSETEFRPPIPLSMKIQTTILSDHLTFRSFHLLRLVVQFISFNKHVTRGRTPEVANNPEIF
jgi:hypothetical protein